jgi:hypothetical protein
MPNKSLYDEVVECVDKEFMFNRDKSIPDGDFEAAYFISEKKDYALEVRNDINSVSIEYGLGLGSAETDSGVEYTRVMNPRGMRIVNSLEEAREFLETIDKSEITLTNSYKFWRPDELIN